MPILNPQQAYNLLKFFKKLHTDQQQTKSLKSFLQMLLPIASRKSLNNRHMIEIHQRFLNYISYNMSKLFEFFNFSKDEIDQFVKGFNDNIYFTINDILSNRENSNENGIKFPSIELDFASYLQQFVKNDYVSIPQYLIHYYVPVQNSTYTWYINQHYAVLAFNHQPKINENELFQIRLTTFLLAATEFTIVACVSSNDNEFYDVTKILRPNFFSETHIYSEISTNNYEKLNMTFFSNKNAGHIYLYAHFTEKSDEYYDLLEKASSSYVKVFLFSKFVNHKSESIFYAPSSIKITQDYTPKESDLTQFDKLPVNLCNVALYKDLHSSKDITPIKISEICIGLIHPSDFILKSRPRIHVELDNENYYVDFTDMHMMNPELYIPDPMYLSKINFDISIVEKINDTYKNNTTISEKVKVKNSNIKLNIEDKMHNAFHYLHKYTKNNGKHIEPYTSQIFAVYQAVSYLSKCGDTDNGVILQVHTGEGKSFIVQALAEHLARQGNIVHIATSNIILAARDFLKAYNYYVNCEKKASVISSKQQKPSILIHSHERKYINDLLDGTICDDIPEKDLFYSDENFNNPTNLNISVCKNDKKIKSNIVYSTFLNFEACYLQEHEKDPYHVSNYINKCYLIIDEADSILVDELTNGTILSKPMKSNSNEVLKLIYDNYVSGNKNSESILELVRNNFKECYDMTTTDIEEMFSQIDKVTSEGFEKKYVIAEDPFNPLVTKIFPFDSEHKGIVELNKEFSGFVHQFVGIKEKKDNPEENENLEIQPLSLNYQFISHPTYVKLYKGVCGVTGTIGNQREKDILKEYYGLSTLKVPRHQMSLRKNLPMILCDTISKRNKTILKEIMNYHNNGYPVLVVFISIKEIKQFKKTLINDYKIEKDKILTFTGKNKKKKKNSNKEANNDEKEVIDQNYEDDKEASKEKLKEEMENLSGKTGYITLGSNFCGRGVDIKPHEKPLCVIVTYYKEDQRSMNQVLGRAGRNGHPGMARIICTKEMFKEGAHTPEESAMKTIISEFRVKNEMQTKYIDELNKKFPWLFNEHEFKEKIPREKALQLRECILNVNRITAFNFQFPVCMSVETFLKIQIQRIFSIKNCPECRHAWNLFRIYMRELVLEAWSLFLDSIDIQFKEYVKKEEIKDEDGEIYNTFFDDKYEEFQNLLYSYIPGGEKNTYIDTFLHIIDKVIESWETKIISSIPSDFHDQQIVKARAKSFTCFRFGFFPMTLSYNSGVKLTPLSPELQMKSDMGNIYILDPELKYVIKGSKNSPFSITKVIDKIYEKFQEICDQKLQGLFGIRFFLRRTLAGCEFGVCIDTEFEPNDNYLNCLLDRTPLLMFTITTKSSFFWIGGILIIVLVFFTSLCIAIATNFIDPSIIGQNAWNFVKTIFLKMMQKDEDKDDESQNALGKLLNELFDNLISFLITKINMNISYKREGYKLIVKKILELFESKDSEKLDEKLNELSSAKLKINEKVMKYLRGNTPFGKMIKIGVLIVVYLITFVMNFRHKKRVKFNSFSKDNSTAYQKQKKLNTNVDITQYNAYKKVTKKIEDTKNDSDDSSDSDSFLWSSDDSL